MATKKTTTKSSSSSSSSSSSKKKTVWGLNKISFWTIVAVTILYAVSLILSACGILAWRYVRPKQMVWKVLYIICLLIVIAGIIVPLVM